MTNQGDMHPHSLRETVLLMGSEMRDSFSALQLRFDALDKERIQERKLQLEICAAHGRRLTDLESWRNRLVGGWAAVIAYFAWRHKL